MAVTPPVSISATIDNSGNLSEELYMGDRSLGHLIMPAAWTAADIAFLVSDSERANGIYSLLYDDAGNVVVVTVGTSRGVSLDSVALKVASLGWYKIQSVTTGTPTTALMQLGQRVIKIRTKR
jgi:hypothetical protein